MEQQVETLYDNVTRICAEYIFIRKNDVFEETKKLLPEISEFSRMFFNNNEYELPEDDYAHLQRLLLDDLADCIQGMEQRDVVLLMDALDFGLREWLKILLPEKRKLEIEEGVDDDV